MYPHHVADLLSWTFQFVHMLLSHMPLGYLLSTPRRISARLFTKEVHQQNAFAGSWQAGGLPHLLACAGLGPYLPSGEANWRLVTCPRTRCVPLPPPPPSLLYIQFLDTLHVTATRHLSVWWQFACRREMHEMIPAPSKSIVHIPSAGVILRIW